MGDVPMPKSVPCKFNARSWGPCKAPSDNGWCSEHEDAMCLVCAKHATRSCDEQMGGLACGAYLCETCRHGPENKHITQAAFEEIERAKQEEEAAIVASRTSPERRMHKELGVPATLFELLKGDWEAEGYQLKRVYFLELRHGLMGFFPAIFSADPHRIVFTTDLHLLENVWRMLAARHATLRVQTGYVHEELGIFYMEADHFVIQERRCPSRLLTTKEFEELAESAEPFRWASGLCGGRDPSREDFLQNLVEQAKKIDPRFTSAAA